MSWIWILWRNMKWRFHNPLTILITILQPMLWLLMYSSVASQTMNGLGIENYTAYILPGLIVLVCFGACSSSGIMNYLMKNEGSFYRILIAPVSRSSIVFGQVVEGVCCAFIEISVMCLFSLLFSVQFNSTLFTLFCSVLLMFMSAFFISSLAYAISLKLPNEIVYETVMNAIVLPIFFLSSALFPIDSLSGVLKVILMLNPFTHVINNLRALMLTGTADSVYLLSVFVMLGILDILGCIFAIKKLNNETEHM